VAWSGRAKIAEATKLSRESLYRALSEEGHPEFETVERVIGALGLRLRAEPIRRRKKQAA
jgi:probable addiction module antidote protein